MGARVASRRALWTLLTSLGQSIICSCYMWPSRAPSRASDTPNPLSRSLRNSYRLNAYRSCHVMQRHPFTYSLTCQKRMSQRLLGRHPAIGIQDQCLVEQVDKVDQ